MTFRHLYSNLRSRFPARETREPKNGRGFRLRSLISFCNAEFRRCLHRECPGRLRAGELGSAPAIRQVMNSPLWSVMFASGSGPRLPNLTGGTPKQFWRNGGSTSLVEETLARLALICPADRTVIVVTEAQREYVNQWLPVWRRGRVVFQPEDRGTAACVLFGLVTVLTTDPNAVVLITPSDHGVANPDVFRSGILDAVSHVELHGGVVLFGVEPVVVARARTLLDLCREHLPNLTAVFVGSLTLPPDTREKFLAARYSHLEAADFPHDVLPPTANLLAHTWPATVGWSGLGTVGWSGLGTNERLRSWLADRASRTISRRRRAGGRATSRGGQCDHLSSSG